MNYWKKGCNHLLKCDPVFKKYYNPKHQLKTNKNKFDVLFKSICSQQISVSAAMSIYKNSKHIIGPVNFANFRNNKNKIKELPLSNNKKKCLISLLENYHLVSKIKLNKNSFDKVNKDLTQIFGIGKWTAEMFSIFYLGLPNIMPLGDLGFINANKKYYNDIKLKKFSNNSHKWRNYSTIVTWYLWSSYDSEPLYL